MNKIIVYEHPNFDGLTREYTSDISNLSDDNFDNCISAVRVIGNPWVAYEEPNYKGKQYIFEEGECANVQDQDRISSLKLVTQDLTNPKITLYEFALYKGRNLVLTCESNLSLGSFGDLTSSHKVQKGAWVLYEHPNRGGSYIIGKEGEDLPTYPNWIDNQVSHVRPLLPGKPYIKAEVLWSEKIERTKSVTIDSICGMNYGNSEQSFTTDMSREYSGSVTESFNFSNSTEISWGTNFNLNIALASAKQSLNIKNTFKVEKGSSNTRTMKNSVKIILPADMAPHTKITVNVVRNEVDVTVPVKLSITTGLTTKTEYGEYRCQAGSNISAEFREEKI